MRASSAASSACSERSSEAFVTVAVKESFSLGEPADRSGRLFDPGADHSLDEVVTAVWGALRLRGSARCLVCGATAAVDAGDAGTATGECPSCGSRLE
jgi:hypothetical protein